MIGSLRLMVVTQAETVLDVKDVGWVQAQLTDGGGIGIWPGHAPLWAETVIAPLRYADESGEHMLELRAGILQIERDTVTILTSGPASDHENNELPGAEQMPFERLTQTLLAMLHTDPNPNKDEGIEL